MWVCGITSGVGVGMWDKSGWVGKLKKYLRIVTHCDRSFANKNRIIYPKKES